MNRPARSQVGVTLIEAMIAMLLLSVGMLSVSGMLAAAVQIPKLAGYRATAVHLAAAHVDKIRANSAAFRSGDYAQPLSYDGTFNDIQTRNCVYPNCNPSTLADMDTAETNIAARRRLPAGGTLTACNPQPCSTASYGNIWIVWNEPDSKLRFNSADSDICPQAVVSMARTPAPRCIYMRFKL